MFSFLRRSQIHRPSPALQRALVGQGLPPGMDPATLGVVESRGSYNGRGVTYLMVFDPQRARERGVAVRAAPDLEAHPDLVLAIGHAERDGSVMLNSPSARAQAPASVRERADRAAHADDEAFVFPDGRPARTENPG